METFLVPFEMQKNFTAIYIFILLIIFCILIVLFLHFCFDTEKTGNLVNRGNLLLKQRNINDASKKYDEAIEKCPYYSPSYDNTVSFVTNIIARVPQGTNNSDSDDSSDEEPSETFNKSFNPQWGNSVHFPYTLYKKNSKITVEERDIEQVKEEELSNATIIADSTVVGPLLSKISKNGFEEHDSKKLSTIAVSIALNCMYSLSKRKNNSLILELKSAVNNTEKIKYERFGYYWKCTWYKTNGRKAAFQEVQTFYKQLKRKDSKMAKEFLKQEDERAGRDVPYQHIREYAKNHHKTKKLIKQFRDKYPTALIYLHLVDADVRDFNGVYSAYLRVIQDCVKSPTVMSTGYEFPNDEGNQAYSLLSHMDRMIRVITAFYIPFGTYYPEPNMCILIPQNRETVEESFIDYNRGNGRTLESPILLNNIKKNRADVSAIFSGDNPIITTSPERAKVCKYTKNPLHFSPGLNKGLTGPNDDDIKNYARVSQSQCNRLNWSKSLFINKSIQYDKNYVSDGENVKTKNNEPLKGVDKQCNKLISDIFKNVNEQELQRKLANRIGRENVDNIVKAIKAIEKFKKDFVTENCWEKLFLLRI